jgi:type I restriction enzyme S subunit
VLLATERVVYGFHSTTESVFKSVLALELESAKLSEMRDYLLPRLLSGEVRVRQPEAVAESAD